MIISPKMTRPQCVYLDFVRAVAAFCVLLGHASAMFLQGGSLQAWNIQVGAVPVFFLISGFLISLSVFQKHKDPHYGFAQYFIDRFCRIYSVFLPALIFTAIVDALIVNHASYDWRGHFNPQTWVGNLFMLQDFPLFQIARRLGASESPWFVSSFGSAAPFWTISIEWWIYMLFGFIVYFGVKAKKPLRLWQWALVACLAIEPVYHFIGGPDRCLTMLWVVGMGVSTLYLYLPKLAASWAMTPRKWRRICFLVAGAAVFALVAHARANMYHQKNAAVYHQLYADITEFQSGVYLAVAVFALFFAFGAFETVPALLQKAVGFVAEYSYSLYLTHSTVLVFMEAHGTNTSYNPRLYWAAILASNFVAVVFWWLFERHHRTLARTLKLFVIPRKLQAQEGASIVEGGRKQATQ